MQKHEAITIIENTFSVAFDEANFTLFVKNFLNDLDTTKYNEFHGSYIKDAFRNHIKKYKRIGKYTDPNGDAMDVLIVEVTDQYHLDHARTSLRNFVISHLDSFEKDYALVAFYSNSDSGADWRFSFVKLEYKTEVKEGKIKQNKELTPAKRYSFLVGEHERAHTAKKQLLPLLENIYNNPTIEDLEKAFSIEAVTDEFFEQYKTLFGNLTDQFEKDSKLKTELAVAGIEIPRFTKKLLGQIVFLYFLQKKGWMGVAKDQKWGTGEKRFLQKLYYEAIDNGKNFFGDYLQFLFYKALAHKHSDEGVQGFYSLLNCKVPFLNGGLFEADYDWENDHIAIPNELFRNTEKIGKNGDIGSGVLDVFDRYNFTIKEDEPLEKEVAVDPEMLGKVFENMLEVTERKSKGAFYTPREIVHYMCQESLIHYLDNAVNTYSKTYQELGNPQTRLFGNDVKKGQHSLILEKDNILIPKEDIETFIRKGFFTLENDQRVIRVGKETRDYHFQLPETIRTNADLLNTKLAEIRICDPAIGSGAFPVGMLHEIVNARLVLKQHLKNHKNPDNPDSDNYSYQLKRHTIQECIYGVDIDASAIDIARLRLWLSLVVDEEDLDTIEALPNLDYKIVCGNSLIGFPENWSSPMFNKLEKLKKKFFEEIDADEKKILKQDIDGQLKERLDTSEKVFGYKVDFDFKLLFSEVWHEKEGFDIVIGNPPYVKARDSQKKQERKLIEKLFKTPYKMWDTYIPFIEISIRLLNSKGTSCMIIPDTLGVAEYTIKLVEFIENYHSLNSIVFFPNQYVFASAAVRSKIVIIGKERKENSRRFEFQNGNFIPLNIVNGIDKYLFEVTDIDLNFENSIKLGDICYVTYGLRLNSDKDDPNKFVKKDLISDNESTIHIKRYTEGKYLEKYKINKVFWLEWNTERCPEKLVRATFPELYEPHKLLLARQKKVATISENGIICDNTIIVCVLHKDLSKTENSNIRKYYNNVAITREAGIEISKEYSLKYLLGIINSEVIAYFLYYHTKGKIDVYPDDWKEIPICHIPPERQLIIELFAGYLLFLNENNSSLKLIFAYLTDVLNTAIYELYFPTKIKLANKEILKHLVDLKPITDEMSPEQKLSIIQSEFARLYDPNHPVRNNVETLDSVEEVRIIREALK